MSDDSDPARKFFELKPREFDRVNPPAVGAEPAFHPAEPRVPASLAQPIDTKELHRQAAAPGAVLNLNRQSRPDAQIEAILKENHAREAAVGMHDVPYQPRRKSKRLQDYIMIVIATVVFFGGLAVYGWFARNPILFGSSIVGLGLTVVSVTWVMFQVMDDY